jgi:cysteine dioxygenase
MDIVDCLASHLGRLSEPSIRNIAKALEQIPGLIAGIRPYITEPGQQPYGRNVIYRDGRMEVIVIHLPPGVKTAIHDHGKSVGCALVVEGELTNTVFESVNRKQARQTAEQIVKPGCFLFSSDGTIHQMSNRGMQRVVTLHVYSPPLAEMTAYEQADASVVIG